MNTTILSRSYTAVVSVLAVAALAAGILWLLAPELGPFTSGFTPVERLTAPASGSAPVGPLIAAALLTAAGAVTAAIGIGLLSGAIPGIGASAAGRVPAVTPIAGSAAIAAGAFVLLGLVGFDGLPAAGYALAFAVPIVVLTAVAVLLVRRPLVGVVLALPVAGVAVLAAFGVFPILAFYAWFAQAIVESPVRILAALGLIAFAGLWMLWGAMVVVRGADGPGAFVERHRVVITVAAAACALPYVVARASWLTPWPLFGGSVERFATDPGMLVTGLLLGAAMLTGAVLTLGLVLPWGRRFPRWLPGIGGRSVPVALAVVPASVVALLFTAAGADLLVQTFTGAMGAVVDTWVMAVVLPFWLWGPLLVLATWGYARHRMAPDSEPAAEARAAV